MLCITDFNKFKWKSGVFDINKRYKLSHLIKLNITIFIYSKRFELVSMVCLQVRLKDANKLL